jgi:hypothetical protein
MRHFSSEDRLSRAQELPSREFDEEVILMSIDAGAYYGMEGSARSIWKLLETPLTFSSLVRELVQEYNVAPEACAAQRASESSYRGRRFFVRLLAELPRYWLPFAVRAKHPAKERFHALWDLRPR